MMIFRNRPHVVWFFVAAFAVVLSVDYLSRFRQRLTSKNKDLVKKQATTMDANSVDPCTFDQIQEAFSGDHRQEHEGQQCWSLEETILRVPASRIVNREDMPRLGRGCLGGVYKAVLELKPRHDASAAYCSVALKTDDCYELFDNPMPGQCKHNNAKACVSGQGDWNYKTFVGGEYTGALPWYAQLETGNYQKGLLPTWAIVQDEERPMKHWVPRAFTTSVPHTDPTIKGIIMPLIQMHFDYHTQTLDPLKLAQLMLPAAEGLDFLSNMGLAMQDMAAGAIAFTADRSGVEHAVIFDNSYMGIDPDAECASPELGAPFSACQFCHEKVFPMADRKKTAIRGFTASGGDLVRFRQVIEGMVDAESPLVSSFLNGIRSSQTALELSVSLRRFIEVNAPVTP